MYADGFTLRWKLQSIASDPASKHTETMKVRSVKRLPTESLIGSLLTPPPLPLPLRNFQFISLDPQRVLSVGKLYLNASFTPSDAMICLLLPYNYVQSIAA